MASKWLEERWELLIPALEPLGCGQEEQIKSICERELLAWKARPSMRVASSLQKPLTETRNRIRESIPVTEENGWLNPKSGLLEHLALKYLNFSTEEWVQINLPPQEELQARQAHVLPLANPSALLAKAEQLMQMSSWPEMAVGIGLTTGRSLVEILHTGHFTQKSAYSILFAGPFTVYERLCDPVPVPTLVQAEQVLDAVQRLRQLFGTHFVGVARHNISRECIMQACEAAYRHLLGLIPFPSALQATSYKRLTRGIYSRLAVLYYCPVEVDEILYLARITNHQEILRAKSQEERLAFAVAASYREYVVLDEQGVPDQRRGIRLAEPGVEVLKMFHRARSEEEEMAPEPEADASQPVANVDRDSAELPALTTGSVQEAEERVSTREVLPELDRVQRLLACFIFEVQVNLIENDPPGEILDTLATLVNHAPAEVLSLVERLRRTPPEEEESDYPCTLPSFAEDDSLE